MILKNKLIIGLSGQKASGKDLSANIIDYIVKLNIRNANYKDWLLYDISKKDKTINTVTHFANPLKEFISGLFDINIEFFNDRRFKDELYIKLYEHTKRLCIGRDSFITKEQAIENKYMIIDTEKLNRLPLSYYMTLPNMCIKIRTLLQYIGTDIGRNMIDNNLWINLVVRKINEISDKYKLCIIPDIRFYNEANIIKQLGGYVIKINRDIEENKKDIHISENENNIKYDYEVNNNSTKFSLFYQLFTIIDKIYKEKRSKQQG